ncbi:hypothetical protein ARC20_06175 [Stenotrophomonas panacihumi]|uniref:Transmembrane protein n=1 Tax=Stenotrophomonas panacihumi TaxID=676599 RepID=A0A0R0AL59_9GAMM|nr:hypothetical protein [Stenotrophomonas panacihumi]KRG45990.1 hypothetical protein ARC20_06175 [Stenotrophomonas panacihumi]PTN56357.1 hypothetical protein C9J98_01165 [Stenotrophomonas panacihumi]
MRKFECWLYGTVFGIGAVLLLIRGLVPFPREHLFTEVFWIFIGVDAFCFIVSFLCFRRIFLASRDG